MAVISYGHTSQPFFIFSRGRQLTVPPDQLQQCNVELRNVNFWRRNSHTWIFIKITIYIPTRIFKKITSLPQITLFASLIPDMYFHACARSKIQITAPPDQLSFFAATNEKGRSHFPYIWISQIFSQIIFSLFAPPINSMTTLYHKGERINANFTGARPPPPHSHHQTYLMVS